ncbi:centrosome-associated protein CEP250-like isoform 1-T10 [Podargus strigoides]
MKTAADRDLSELKAEQMGLSGSILVNCSCLNSSMQLWEPITVGRPVLKDQAQQQVGQEINQKTHEVMHLQVEGDLEKKELQDSDCANLEETRDELQQQLELMEQEALCMCQSNTEAQLKEDSAQGEKVEQQQKMERA